MTQESHHGIQLDACDRCQGLWFDRGELTDYWAASNTAGEPPPVDSTAFESDPDSKPLICPACKTETLELRWIDVFIGGPCSTCRGIWLTPARGNKIPEKRAPGKVGPDWVERTGIEIVLDLLLHHFR